MLRIGLSGCQSETPDGRPGSSVVPKTLLDCKQSSLIWIVLLVVSQLALNRWFLSPQEALGISLLNAQLLTVTCSNQPRSFDFARMVRANATASERIVPRTS